MFFKIELIKIVQYQFHNKFEISIMKNILEQYNILIRQNKNELLKERKFEFQSKLIIFSRNILISFFFRSLTI